MKETTYPNLTLLCIEDEEGVRRTLVNTLKYYFGEVIEAKNGAEGLEKYRKHAPDIILCDIEMPIMNGIEVVRAIRKEDSLTPIVMLTAYSSETYLMNLINLHVQHFILKPASIDRLLGGIAEAFAGKYSGVCKLSENARVEIAAQRLYSDDIEIALTKRETLFLAMLVQHRGQVVSYEMIEQELWADKSMSESALKSFIRDLRKKLPHEWVENVSKFGYRLGEL